MVAMSEAPNPKNLAAIPDAEESVLPIQQYWNVILKRIWTILLVSLAVFTLVAVYTFKQRKVYEARTSLIIELSTPQVLGRDVQPVMDLSQADLWNTDQYFETQYRIIKSRKLAEKVVEKLGLADDPVFLGIDHLEDEEKISKALQDIDPIERLISLTEVEPAAKTRIVTVKVRHTNPKMAAQLANTIAETYQSQNIEQRRESTYGAYEWLTEQYREVKEKLEASDAALYNFKRDNNILSTSLEDRQNITSQRLQDLNRQITDIQAERLRLQAEVDQIKRYHDGKHTGAPIAQVIDNPLVQNLKTSWIDLRKRDAELSSRYLDQHPEVLAIRKQIKVVEDDLRKEVDNILSSSENRLRAVQSTEGGLRARLEELKDEALEINEKEVTYRQIERENETNQRLYELVLKRLKETDISRLLQENNIRLLDRALVPEEPVAPKVLVNLLIGLVLGLVCGVALAFLREMTDNTVKTQEDVEDLLGLTFLGVIPSIKEAQRGPDKGQALADGPRRDMHVHEFPKSTVAECCRTIRTNILFMSPDRRMRRLMVTSAGPREGKTVSVANMAITMAQSNSRVLIVDTDMRRPRVHKVFGLHNEVGLTNLILGELDYDQTIKRTPVPNLDVLMCGPIPPNPAELLHTARFQEIVLALEARYDLIIFDSPPTIAVTDSMILSQMVDGVLLVVKGGQTSKAFVRQARERLVGVNAPILGCILNDVDLEDRQYGQQSYYYYRQYGQYYTEDAEEQEG
jgi:succinoglycan biosynthesis transport protein ExoP